MPFFEELQRRTSVARAELFAIPVIQECLAGRATREQYLAFLGQAYHHVRCPPMSSTVAPISGWSARTRFWSRGETSTNRWT